MPNISHQDNFLCGAHNLGQLKSNNRWRGFIGERDRVDFYKFSLADASLVTLNLGRLRGSTNFKLLDDRGQVLLQGKRSCLTGEAIDTPLEAGRYYLRISKVKRDTPYVLTAATSPMTALPETIALEDLGSLAAGNTAKLGAVSAANRVDYYQFNLSQIGDFTANLGLVKSPVRMSLYADQNGNHLPDSDEQIATLDSSDSGNTSFSPLLAPGSYLLGIATIAKPKQTVPYTLTLTSRPTPGTLSADPGEDSNQAYDLGSLAKTTTVKELIGSSDAADFYKFSLSQISGLNISLSNLSRPAATTLYFDANGNGLADSDEIVISSSGDSTISLGTDLPIGTYLLSVTDGGAGSNPNTRYSLSLFQTPKPGDLATDPGSEVDQSYELGQLSGPRIVKDLVGGLDETDFYKFTLDQISGFNANLSGLSRSASITLYADRNGNGLAEFDEVVSSAYAYNTSTSLSTDLPEGTYFLSVTDAAGYLGKGNTRYSLSLSQTPKPTNLASDPADDSFQAYSLGTLPGTTLAKDYLGNLDSRDFYRFSLNQSGQFNASLINAPWFTEMILFADSNGNQLADPFEQVGYMSGYYSPYGSGNLLLSQFLGAGNYFLLLNSSSGSGGAYTLTLSM